MQNFRVTNKEHYGMLWYFLEWSIASLACAVPTHQWLHVAAQDLID